MSSFFNQLSQIETTTADTADHTHNNPHAVPPPAELAAATRLLQSQFASLHLTAQTRSNAALLEGLMQFLESEIDHPPDKVAGVPQSYLDELERVPKKQCKHTQYTLCI